MSDVTDADRKKAAQVLDVLSLEEAYADEYIYDGSIEALRTAIATALAEERERARDEVFRELAQLAGRKWYVAPEEDR